jgi:hypothetical protein
MQEILAALLALLKSLPILDRWLTKTPSEKIEDAKEDIAGALDKMKENGRPRW